MTRDIVGQPAARVEGPEKVTGSARYSADIDLPDLLWGKILRSPVAHGRIKSIDTSAAEALPGVHAVITGKQFPYLTGRTLKDMPVLAFDKVRYVGDRVAAVAAESRDIAEQAVNLIEVEYEPLPAVLDVRQAMAADAPAVHEDPKRYLNAFTHPDEPQLPNLCAYGRFSNGDLEAGFAEAAHIFEHEFFTPAVHHGYLEPNACVVATRPDGGAQVWASNKSPYMLRMQLAACFELPPEKFTVNMMPVGGDFGGKGSPFDTPVAYLLSREAGRPVKIVMTYTEELMAGNTRHAGIGRIKTGVRADGTICALRYEGFFNGGAYGAYRPLPNQNLHGVDQVASCYRVPAIDIHSSIFYSNTLPGGHMRSPGAPQVTFAVERQFDLIADALGLDRLEFRLRNLLSPGDAAPLGTRWHTIRTEQVLRAAAQAIGWEETLPANTGLGLAMYERSTVGGDCSVRLTLQADGTLDVLVPIPDPGQGMHTALRQMVQEALGGDARAVTIAAGSTDDLPFDYGVGGSRTTYALGTTTMKALDRLREQLLGVARDRLGADDDAQATWRGGDLTLGNRTVPWEQLAAWAGEAGNGALSVLHHEPLPLMEGIEDTNFTAQAVRARVDPETGQVTLEKVVTVHDVGTIINPVSHRGQIEGGLVFGLGEALMSEYAYQEEQPAALHLGDYKIPCIADIPPLEIVLLERDEGPGPFNCGPIAEAANVAIPAAVANAVAAAIQRPVHRLPLCAERVYALLQG